MGEWRQQFEANLFGHVAVTSARAPPCSRPTVA